MTSVWGQRKTLHFLIFCLETKKNLHYKEYYTKVDKVMHIMVLEHMDKK